MKPEHATTPSEAGDPEPERLTIRLRPGESTEEMVQRFRRLLERKKARERASAGTSDARVPFEEQTTLQMVKDYFANPEAWLDHPNPVFGGRTPRSLIGKGDEAMIRNRLIAANYGLFG
jgi:hypothetical protein